MALGFVTRGIGDTGPCQGGRLAAGPRASAGSADGKGPLRSLRAAGLGGIEFDEDRRRSGVALQAARAERSGSQMLICSGWVGAGGLLLVSAEPSF